MTTKREKPWTADHQCEATARQWEIAAEFWRAGRYYDATRLGHVSPIDVLTEDNWRAALGAAGIDAGRIDDEVVRLRARRVLARMLVAVGSLAPKARVIGGEDHRAFWRAVNAYAQRFGADTREAWSSTPEVVAVDAAAGFVWPHEVTEDAVEGDR